MAQIHGDFGVNILQESPFAASRGPQTADVIDLSDNVFMFPHRTIGHHDNIFEGEVRSSVYGVRPCVIKFATISEQNIREAEILTKLGSHTNVIAIIQSGTYCDLFEERVYIALDKCHNENLRQYLANRKAAKIEFDLSQAIDFAKQIIVGVMYIHNDNVIHLDLKPSNILISQNLTLIKIADFGLSIIVKSPKSKVFHKRQFGTNGYRPVESFGHGEVSMRTDIFSLGTVLLHLLSNGNDVFGLDEHSFIHNVKNDVTDISGLLVGNPVTTKHLIKCMVSKERCRRPTIWEVSDHPCWLGKEVECNFEYFGDDEIDDNASHDKDTMATIKKKIESHTDIENERKFLAKMREMGFNRKPTIVVFDRKSKHLFRFDIVDRSMMQMHGCHDLEDYNSSVAVLGEYIYSAHYAPHLWMGNYRLYRLEYCDVTATWEQISWPKWEDAEGYFSVTASSDALYLVRRWGSRSVFKYDPSLDEWKRLPDRPESSYLRLAVVYNNGFLYCIEDNVVGGRSNKVNRLDPRTMEWTRMADTNRLHSLPVAVEYGQNIYVFGCVSMPLMIEKYDPEANEWTDVEFTGATVGLIMEHKALVIDGNIYLIDHHGILKFDINNSRLTVVAEFPDMVIQGAVLVQMSN